MSAAQLALGQPAWYGLPSAIPQLRLGEMVYHPAHEPRDIAASSARLVVSALGHTARDVAVRTAHADVLQSALADARGVALVRPLRQAAPGYLRLPLRLAHEVTLPAALNIASSTLIWSEVSFVYTPAVGKIITGPLTLKDQLYMAPRLTNCVTYPPTVTTCP